MAEILYDFTEWGREIRKTHGYWLVFTGWYRMLHAVPPAPTHLAVRSEADFRVYEVHPKAPQSPCQCVCIFVSVTVKQKGTAQLSVTLNYFLTPNYLLAIPSVSDTTARMTLTEKNSNAYKYRSRIAMVWAAVDMQHLDLWVNIYCNCRSLHREKKMGQTGRDRQKNKSTVDSLMAYRQKCCVMFMAQLQTERILTAELNNSL